MKSSHSRLWLSVLALLVAFCAAPAAHAQQPAAPASPQAAAPGVEPAQAAPVDTQAASPASRPAQPARIIPHDLSPWSMFLSADVFVQGVMISLAFASLVTWTILFAKLGELALARRRVNAALRRIANARSLAEARVALGTRGSVVAAFLAAAVGELRLSEDRF